MPTRRESTLLREDVNEKGVTPIEYAANTKFQPYQRNSKPERAPFSGNDAEKTYLLYFATGDLYTSWNGRKVMLQIATTHPAQLWLMRDLFIKYGKPIIFPVKNNPAMASPYSWRCDYLLDRSFEFLVNLPKRVRASIMKDDALFYAALSGFADAEGHVGLGSGGGYVKGREPTKSMFIVSNSNKIILDDFQAGLEQRGFSSSFRTPRDEIGAAWDLGVFNRNAVRLLPKLGLRHAEKIAAKKLVFTHWKKPWAEVRPLYRAFRDRIKFERDSCVRTAEMAYLNRSRMKLYKKEKYREISRRAFTLRLRGLTIDEIARALGKSPRTVYRRLALEDEIRFPTENTESADK